MTRLKVRKYQRRIARNVSRGRMRTIQAATNRFASAVRISTWGAVNPPHASAAAAPEPATMNSAFITLLAATMRERSAGRAASCMMA